MALDLEKLSTSNDLQVSGPQHLKNPMLVESFHFQISLTFFCVCAGAFKKYNNL
jgi:hypothetical protein